MKTRPTFYSAALCLVLIAACSSSRTPVITAYTDPDFHGRSYEHIVVAADVADLEIRRLVESALVEELRERGIDAEESTRLFPPTRTWMVDERLEALRRRGSDGLLRIKHVSSWSTEEHVPLTTTTEVRRESDEKSEKGEGASKQKSEEKETIMTTTSGGYVVRSDVSRYQIDLVDVPSDRVAWVGVMTLDAQGSTIGRFRTSVVKQLMIDRHIAATD